MKERKVLNDVYGPYNVIVCQQVCPNQKIMSINKIIKNILMYNNSLQRV